MNILTFGDVVGNCGINKIKEELPSLKNEYKIDFTIANAENAAEGIGITVKNFKDLLSAGVNCITMGDHVWGKKEIFQIIDEPELLRPINYPDGVCGKGYNIYNFKNKRIAVINALGRAEINVPVENPFLKIKTCIDNIKSKADIIFLDFHAEATGEKQAMGYYLDGQITAMYGTHTHIPTADERIMEKGMAYITDVGMTGPKHSVLGMEIDVAIKRSLTAIPEKYRIAHGEAILNCCLYEIDDNTNKVVKISRISR